MTAEDGFPEDVAMRPGSRWLAWLLGTAILGALILVVMHGAEERELAQLLGRAEPWWLGWAAVLQAATYLVQGAVWLTAVHAAGHPVSTATACRLSVAKRFVDQALPSAGVSGTVVMAKALEDRHVPRPVVMASVVVSTASYFVSQALSILAALTIAVSLGHADRPVTIASLLLVVGAIVVVAAVLGLSGGRGGTFTRRLREVRVAKPLLEVIAQAEPRLAHHPRLLVRATGLQLVIVLLEAATLWVLVRSLGTTTPFAGVFASFVISNVVRALSFVPGGLGAFEAAAVVSLTLAGLPAVTALSATLLFRGFSFWLPMLPGLILSRRLAGRPRRS